METEARQTKIPALLHNIESSIQAMAVEIGIISPIVDTICGAIPNAEADGVDSKHLVQEFIIGRLQTIASDLRIQNKRLERERERLADATSQEEATPIAFSEKSGPRLA